MRQRSSTDEGFTLIEVVVALLVFAILSTGIVAATTTIVRMTGDNRARITAANLASQDLDVVRAIEDPFSIADSDGYITVDRRTYHVTRQVSWISASGLDVSCNSSTNLFFLRVNVRVSWPGMLGTTPAVQDDTILAPTDGTTDSTTGALAIKVEGAAGQPVGGVNVVVAVHPGAAGAAPTSAPKPTTSQGCTYANELTPGTYDITITKGGYRGDDQTTSPKATITVSAGNTQSYTFAYDQAATYTTTYDGGPADAPSGRVPSNLATDLLTGSTVYATASPDSKVLLYPSASGYTAFTGTAEAGTRNCASIDPQAWLAGTVNGVALEAGKRGAAAAGPGGTAPLSIPMGVVRVRAAAGATLTATQGLPTGQGNPGCSVTGSVLRWSSTAPGGWVTLQLPYGSWKVLADGTALGAADVQVLSNVALPGVSFDGTVTLDPRKAQ